MSADAKLTNQNYNLFDYGGMINAKNMVQTEAFTTALKNCITPETVVLDVGTGTGYFALVAAKLGARHVYAIEPNPAIQIGREAAADNGLADRITFIQGMSNNVKLPEKVDVIISDIGGALPLCGPLIGSLADARERFLKPDGIMLPERDSLCAALVRAPGIYDSYTAPWDDNPAGLDFHRARQRVTSLVRKQPFQKKNLASSLQEWASVDYGQLNSPHYDSELNWTPTQAGPAHGLALWFDRIFPGGQQFSNAPDEIGNPIYGNLYLPWSEPVDLAEDDTVTVKLRASFVDGNYIWSWQTSVRTDQDVEKSRFSQSSFLSQFKGAGRLDNAAPVGEQESTQPADELAAVA